MLDMILAFLVGLAVIFLAVLSIRDREAWHMKAAIVVGVVAVLLIGAQAWRSRLTQEQVQGRLDEIKIVAQQILAGTKNDSAEPRPVAVPTLSITKHDSDVANQLGTFRHAGRKRYLEWIAGYPDAEQKADAWRVQVASILETNYGVKVSSRFNEPNTTEAIRVPVPGGTALMLSKAIEHGHRVDRLGEIINDIVAGKISSRRAH